MKNQPKPIKQQVRELQRRLDSNQPVMKFMVNFQMTQLARAEELRKLAVAVVESRVVVGLTGTGVNRKALDDLAALLKKITSFHSPRGKMPASVRRLLAK